MSPTAPLRETRPLRTSSGRGTRRGRGRRGALRVGERNEEGAPGPHTQELKTALGKKFGLRKKTRREKNRPPGGPRETDAEAAFAVSSPGLPTARIPVATGEDFEKKIKKTAVAECLDPVDSYDRS